MGLCFFVFSTFFYLFLGYLFMPLRAFFLLSKFISVTRLSLLSVLALFFYFVASACCFKTAY